MPSLAAPTACRTKTTTGTATASVSGSYPSNSYVRLASCGRDQALKKNETGSEQSVVVVVYICKAVSCPPSDAVPCAFTKLLPLYYTSWIGNKESFVTRCCPISSLKNTDSDWSWKWTLFCRSLESLGPIQDKVQVQASDDAYTR